MAFNSNTYHANKSARTSADYLAQARDLKARAATGDLRYRGEDERLPHFVQMARSYARQARLYRSLNTLKKGIK